MSATDTINHLREVVQIPGGWQTINSNTLRLQSFDDQPAEVIELPGYRLQSWYHEGEIHRYWGPALNIDSLSMDVIAFYRHGKLHHPAKRYTWWMHDKEIGLHVWYWHHQGVLKKASVSAPRSGIPQALPSSWLGLLPEHHDIRFP